LESEGQKRDSFPREREVLEALGHPWNGRLVIVVQRHPSPISWFFEAEVVTCLAFCECTLSENKDDGLGENIESVYDSNLRIFLFLKR
jgi:hypothetical protein